MTKYDDNRIAHLNRNSALPLYYQLKEHIKEAILGGYYKPNDRLPTEEQLCKDLSVSRPVVRQAYEELLKEGLIGRRKGSGTFVKARSTTNSLFEGFVNFSFEENIANIKEDSKILKIEVVKNETISRQMRLAEDSELLRVVRIVHDKTGPKSMIESFLPCEYFFNIKNYVLLAMEKTIIELLEIFYGTHLKRANRELKTSIISEEKAEFLQGKKDDLVYQIETTYFDTSYRIVILERYFCLTSKMSLIFQIDR